MHSTSCFFKQYVWHCRAALFCRRCSWNIGTNISYSIFVPCFGRLTANRSLKYVTLIWEDQMESINRTTAFTLSLISFITQISRVHAADSPRTIRQIERIYLMNASVRAGRAICAGTSSPVRRLTIVLPSAGSRGRPYHARLSCFLGKPFVLNVRCFARHNDVETVSFDASHWLPPHTSKIVYCVVDMMHIWPTCIGWDWAVFSRQACTE